jgi:Putative adhesin
MPPLRKACGPFLIVAALVAGACEMSIGNLAGRASDEWTRTYQLAPGGELEVLNTNGRVEIEGTDGSTVDVRAERIAKAATDAGARELLTRITIHEDARPDHVRLETERMSGVMIGASFEVRYYIKAPKGAAIRATESNGQVSIAGIDGRIAARTTNGAVTARDVSGAIEAGTTNGAVNVDVRSLSNPIKLSTTNGGVTLTLPDAAKADLVATVTNGGISVTGLKLETTEQSRRRVEGKINGGGQPIDLHTTNGGVRVRGKSASAEAPKNQ